MMKPVKTNKKQNDKSGQTVMEYIMVVAVLVGVSYALKAPMSRYLVKFFSGFNSRAVGSAARPTNLSYVGGTKGCSAITGPGAGGGSCE